MTGTIVDDVLAGRRFPYSRTFARAGFTPDDAERWRRAGWHEADDAAPWLRIETDEGPEALLALRQDGYEPDEVAHVARFARRHTAAWTRVLLPRDDSPEIEIDLRDRVLANLHRDARLRHPASWTADQLR